MAANALAHIRFTLDLNEETIDQIVGRPDDNSEGWRQDAFNALEDHLRDGGFVDHLNAMTNAEPEVEVDIA